MLCFAETLTKVCKLPLSHSGQGSKSVANAQRGGGGGTICILWWGSLQNLALCTPSNYTTESTILTYTRSGRLAHSVLNLMQGLGCCCATVGKGKFFSFSRVIRYSPNSCSWIWALPPAPCFPTSEIYPLPHFCSDSSHPCISLIPPGRTQECLTGVPLSVAYSWGHVFLLCQCSLGCE